MSNIEIFRGTAYCHHVQCCIILNLSLQLFVIVEVDFQNEKITSFYEITTREHIDGAATPERILESINNIDTGDRKETIMINTIMNLKTVK